jgi:hypothetical protein
VAARLGSTLYYTENSAPPPPLYGQSIHYRLALYKVRTVRNTPSMAAAIERLLPQCIASLDGINDGIDDSAGRRHTVSARNATNIWIAMGKKPLSI